MIRPSLPLLLPMLLAALVFADKTDEKKIDLDKVVREIEIAAAGRPGPGQGKATAPTIIKSAEDLAAAIADEADRKAIAGKVDFTAEQLVLFRWAGSGQDKITHTAKVQQGLEVTFHYAPGRTKDLRQHAKLFAVAKNAMVKVAGGK